jgi:membrane fusion protein (multidrug efflux system)
MPKPTIPIFLLLAFLFACKGGAGDKKAVKANPPVLVDVIVADTAHFPTSIEVHGTVLSEEMIELRPEVNGRLTYLNIPDGATVTEGTVLARINDADLRAELEEARVKLKLAELKESRLKPLLAVKGVDASTYDAALSDVNLIKAGITLIEARIDKTVIKAPFTGKLGLRLVSEGAYVTPATLIGTLQQTDKIKIDFTIPEVYEGLVEVGKSVSIRTTNGNEILTATIAAVEPQVDISSRNLKVRARLQSGTLNPGAFVKVLLDDKAKGIIVPTQVIIPEALSNLVVLVKDGKAVFTKVETGIRTESAVEIISGVEPGDTVVVTGVLFARPKAPVRIRSVKKLAEVVKS